MLLNEQKRLQTPQPVVLDRLRHLSVHVRTRRVRVAANI